MNTICALVVATGLMVAGQPALADTTQARCDIYPAGSDHIETMQGCQFSQRQGYVTIAREDGVIHRLTPDTERPARYTDEDNNPATREDGLGEHGLIFRLKSHSIFVYWDTSALQPSNEDNITAPFTTQDYDATALVRCRKREEDAYQYCPAGVLRMDSQQASVVILGLDGRQFTINFMTGHINASNREVRAERVSDKWVVTVNETDIYEVPLVLIEGD